jgi:hypothetical protein
MWFWSLAVLPLWISLSFTCFRIPVFLAMATTLFHPLYLAWASFLFGEYGMSPGPVVWGIMLLVVAGFMVTFVTRLRELGKPKQAEEKAG